MAAHTCFNCGEPTETMVAKVNGSAYKRFICMKEQCWAAWRKIAEK